MACMISTLGMWSRGHSTSTTPLRGVYMSLLFSHETVFWLRSYFGLLFFLPRSVLLQQIWIQNVPEVVFERRWDGARNTPFTVLCCHEGQVRCAAQMAIRSEGRRTCKVFAPF